MNINAYIQSGIIESYVLGLATPEEIAELEKLKLQHPELEHAVNSFAVSLENTLIEQAVKPEVFVKDRVMAEIKQARNTESPSLSPDTNEEIKTPKIFATIRLWRSLAAASVILLVVSAAFNISFYNKYSQKNKEYQNLLAERTSLFAANQVYQTKLNGWQQTIEMLGSPEMTSVKMNDPAGKTNNLATVLWNTKSKQVFLIPNKLPPPVEGKQYQLWALVDGKPVDAGLLHFECSGACEMKTIPKAQAFAITLEKKGGSPTPDLNALYVLGNI